MNEADRIRKRKSYQKFAEILGWLSQSDPCRAEILARFHRLMDELRAYGSKRSSRLAGQSLVQLCKDRELTLPGASAGDAR